VRCKVQSFHPHGSAYRGSRSTCEIQHEMPKRTHAQEHMSKPARYIQGNAHTGAHVKASTRCPRERTHLHRVEIEMVCGLVEQQQVWLRVCHHRKSNSRLLTTRKCVNRTDLHVTSQTNKQTNITSDSVSFHVLVARVRICACT
jgi:hypothetical protein